MYPGVAGVHISSGNVEATLLSLTVGLTVLFVTETFLPNWRR
jgi:hypothetical protein